MPLQTLDLRKAWLLEHGHGFQLAEGLDSLWCVTLQAHLRLTSRLNSWMSHVHYSLPSHLLARPPALTLAASVGDKLVCLRHGGAGPGEASPPEPPWALFWGPLFWRLWKPLGSISVNPNTRIIDDYWNYAPTQNFVVVPKRSNEVYLGWLSARGRV